MYRARFRSPESLAKRCLHPATVVAIVIQFEAVGRGESYKSPIIIGDCGKLRYYTLPVRIVIQWRQGKAQCLQGVCWIRRECVSGRFIPGFPPSRIALICDNFFRDFAHFCVDACLELWNYPLSMPAPSAMSYTRRSLHAAAAPPALSAALAIIPRELQDDPARLNALIDMASGVTEHHTAGLNGLTRDQCAHLKHKYRATYESLLPLRDKLLSHLSKGAAYSLIRTGYDAISHMSGRKINPHQLASLVNSAQILLRIARNLEDYAESGSYGRPPPLPPDARRVMAELRDMSTDSASDDPQDATDPAPATAPIPQDVVSPASPSNHATT